MADDLRITHVITEDDQTKPQPSGSAVAAAGAASASSGTPNQSQVPTAVTAAALTSSLRDAFSGFKSGLSDLLSDVRTNILGQQVAQQASDRAMPSVAPAATPRAASGLARVAAAAGPLAIAVGAATAGFVALRSVVNRVRQGMAELIANIQELSPQVATAQAEGDIARIESRLRQAERFGQSAADTIRAETQRDIALEELKASISSNLSPIARVMARLETNGLRSLEALLKLTEPLANVAEAIESVDKRVNDATGGFSVFNSHLMNMLLVLEKILGEVREDDYEGVMEKVNKFFEQEIGAREMRQVFDGRINDPVLFPNIGRGLQ